MVEFWECLEGIERIAQESWVVICLEGWETEGDRDAKLEFSGGFSEIGRRTQEAAAKEWKVKGRAAWSEGELSENGRIKSIDNKLAQRRQRTRDKWVGAVAWETKEGVIREESEAIRDN